MASALMLAAPRPALAERRELQQTQAPPEAMAHFERGRDHFRAGRYREAIVELKAALALDPDSPTLLYNVAYTHELLGEPAEAIPYYRQYLARLPPSQKAEREKTRLTLERLEARRARVAAEPRAPAAHAPAPAAAQPAGVGRADAWFWASLAGGAVLLGGGAAAGLVALDREDAAAAFVAGRDGTAGERQALVDEADRLALASDVLFIGGGALVTTAALLFFLRAPDAERPSAALSVSTDGRAATVQLGARF